MVCIAAFIILCIVGIFVAFISIFRRDIGKKYLKVFKQSLACVGKKATLQKCETGFKDNIKNGFLARIALTNPKLLKPASIGIEILAVLIVCVTFWSLIESAKAGLALWTLGTCNVEHPASCALTSTEICSIDGATAENPLEYIGQWFSDWGEIFSAIPDKFRNWNAEDLGLIGIKINNNDQPKAIDIMDPGCTVCAVSFKTQQKSNFFDNYDTTIVPYIIRDSDGTSKFPNSEIIVRFILATQEQGREDVAYKIINRIFTEDTEDGISYQKYFNEVINQQQAEKELQSWLKEFGYKNSDSIIETANSDKITEIINTNQEIVNNVIHAKGIPTMIYDGKKHTGMFK